PNAIIGSNLEQSLRSRGYRILYSPSNRNGLELSRAQADYGSIFKNVENEDVDFVFSSQRCRVIISPAWEVVVLSDDQDEALSFGCRLIAHLTTALQHDNPEVFSPEPSRRIEWWLFIATFLASVPAV